MPKKVRELMKELKMAGFVDRGGKGSHYNFIHPSGIPLTLSGHPGDDAKPYQLRLVKKKIEEIQNET
jgi:predicted RNA binding protein YcfA (HicA-like mRNA interferase family)